LGAHPDWRVTTLDKLTYAGRRENLHDVMDNPRHTFVHGDIADAAVSGPLVERSEIVVHFAAETHVDRSIMAAGDFIRTDVEGTFVLLEAARRAKNLRRFVQISTDEVYGSVPTGASVETDELKPRNPYAASKAGADRLAYSYWATYELPVVITRASNNYGPYQFPEKVLPLFVTNAIDDIPVPLYGDGKNVRDWLHVLDHCRAVDMLIDRGTDGEVYNIGGGNDIMNIELTHRILDALGKPRSLIKPVADRPGHDRRYCLDTTKLRGIGWTPQVPFESGIIDTVTWYQQNEWWWRPIKEGDPAFKAYYQAQYEKR
jgi:dTDP-glucose 4,6-dehydratase